MEAASSEELSQRLAELTAQMSDPIIQRDAKQMKKLSDEHGEARAKLVVVEALEKTSQERAEAKELAAEETGELREMAKADLEKLTQQEAELKLAWQELLLAKDPRDQRNVILEIRAGAGGDEAGLFATELLRAYTRFAEKVGWGMHVISSSQNEQGGYKEVVVEVTGRATSTGPGPFGTLKFERGVHRVQRIPETDKQGRIHTSTVTVAVMAEAEEIDIEVKTEDLRIDTFRASGAGGQHVNKTDSAIRITHLPTSTVVAVQDERSQHKNKAKALKILRARMLEAQEESQRQTQGEERRGQVGTGDRSEKIRTYNYPQDRITDHRIKKSWSNIESVMVGNLDNIFADLREAEKNWQLKQGNEN